MKSYKVVKSGEPLEEQQIDKPSPSGKEILIKQFLVVSAIQIYIFMMVILTWVMKLIFHQE